MSSDFLFSLAYLAITGTGAALISGTDPGAGYLTFWAAVGLLPLIISRAHRHG